MTNITRRIGTATAVFGTVLAVTLVNAGPAQAACSTNSDLGFYNGYVNAYNYRYCWDPDSETDLPVNIYKKLADGQWVIVAQGTGSAYYQCVGTAPHWFSLNFGITKLFNCD